MTRDCTRSICMYFLLCCLKFTIAVRLFGVEIGSSIGSESSKDHRTQNVLVSSSNKCNHNPSSIALQASLEGNGLDLTPSRVFDTHSLLGKRPRTVEPNERCQHTNVVEKSSLGQTLKLPGEADGPEAQHIEPEESAMKIAELNAENTVMVSLSLALQLLKKQRKTQAYRPRVEYFKKVLLEEHKKVTSGVNGFRVRHGEKIDVKGLPIVLIKIKGDPRIVVRLQEYREVHHVAIASPKRLRSLFLTLDFFHAIAAERGLDQAILGRESDKNLHQLLLDWVLTIIFRPTKDSIPLLGYFKLTNLQKNARNLKAPHELFSDVQAFLAHFLTARVYNTSKLCDVALSLMAHWYQRIAPRAENVPTLSYSDFWIQIKKTLVAYKKEQDRIERLHHGENWMTRLSGFRSL